MISALLSWIWLILSPRNTFSGSSGMAELLTYTRSIGRSLAYSVRAEARRGKLTRLHWTLETQ